MRLLPLLGLWLTVLLASSPAAADEDRSSASGQYAIARELRLATANYRLAVANADQCPVSTHYTGLLLHELGAYPSAQRPGLARLHELSGGFGVRGVVPGSAADRAGLRVGDEIIGLEETDLRAFRLDLVSQRPSFDRIEAFMEILGTRSGPAPVHLAVRRGSEHHSARLQSTPGCGGLSALIDEPGRAAWTDGRYVALTPRMVDFARNDSELAFVVAHEMAHNIMDQAAPGRPPSLAQRMGLGSAALNHDELKADALGVGLMARAGFALNGPQHLLDRLRQARWFAISLTHPSFARRKVMVQIAIDRLSSP